MTLDEIHNAWSKDALMDETQLNVESLKIPLLHAKYYRIFSAERLKLKELEGEYRRFELEKYEFYSQGGSKEQYDKGWKLPPRGVLIKSEVDRYLQADPDIIERNLRISVQKEKLNALESIIDSINKRSYTIRNAIEFLRWTQGS